MQMIKDAKNYGQEDLDELFKRTCIRLDFEDIKYLLTSSDLNLKPDIHRNNDEAFAWLMNGEEDEGLEVINYLITQHNIEKTYSISNLLNRMPTEFTKRIDEMFAIRDLKQSLERELDNNEVKAKRNKV